MAHYRKSGFNRVLSVFIAFVFIVNVAIFDVPTSLSLTTTTADTTNGLEPQTLFENRLSTGLGYIYIEESGESKTYTPTNKMWATCNSNVVWVDPPTTTAETETSTEVATTETVTTTTDVAKSLSIGKVYASNTTEVTPTLGDSTRFGYTTVGADSTTGLGTKIDTLTTTTDPTTTVSSKAYSGYSGTIPTALSNYSTLYYTVEHDGVWNVDYRKYYVSTADQLAVLLYYYQNDFDSQLAEANISKKLSIQLLCDIDLGGVNGKTWYGYKNTGVFLEIDGQGHTIYNGYFSTTSNYFLKSDQQVCIHDVTFSNMFIGHSSGMFCTAVKWFYCYNVDFTNCVACKYANNDSDANRNNYTIVLGKNYLNCYFKDCTVSKSYVLGYGHCSTFASFNTGTVGGTYLGDTSSKTTDTHYYTEIPTTDKYTSLNIEYNGNKATISTNVEYFETTIGTVYVKDNDSDKYYKLTSGTYPSIYEDCAVVDCEIYDTDAHSGTFVSCAIASIIFKGCFTNSTIYGSSKTGVFIGADIGSADGFYYNVEGTKTRVSCYFEDCYSSGIVEGESEIGGFIGTVFNDIERPDAKDRSGSKTTRGIAVFKNCYSTSLVGLEYTGTAVGGFIGSMRGGKYGDSKADQYHLFINCYAAGEVGTITTYTGNDDGVSTNADGSDNTSNCNSIGGFIGTYDTYRPYFKMQNCYYDMQTTAMRERAVGNAVTSWANSLGTGGTLKEITAETVQDYNYDETVDRSRQKLSFSETSLDDKVELTGTYTKSSTKNYSTGSKSGNVEGLADTEYIMDSSNNTLQSSSSSWTYYTGYYPILDRFLTYSKSYNTTTQNQAIREMYANRSEIYYRYAIASTSTVFLDHYDEYMSTSGSVVTCTDSTVYDTVRDITSAFSFTSDGNADPNDLLTTNNAWLLNDTLNSSEAFTGYFGVQHSSTDTDQTIYDQTIYTDTYTLQDETTATYDRSDLKVITITPSTVDETGTLIDQSNSKYVYTCTEFAPGKQWVKVQVFDDVSIYSKWNAESKAYDQVVLDNKRTTMLLNSFANVIGKQYSESTSDTEGYKTFLIETIQGLDLTQSRYTTMLTDMVELCISDSETNTNTSADFKALVSNLQSVLNDTNLLKNNGIGYVTSYISNYVDTEDTTNYTKSSTPDYSDDAVVGTRSLRLLPSAYVDAGNDMKIAITTTDDSNTDSTAETTNSFTIVGYDGGTYDYFQHNVNTSYAITSKSRLGTASNYQGQTIETMETLKGTLDSIGGSTFAVADTFQGIDYGTTDNPYCINKMTDMALIGDSAETGQTIVKVYTTTKSSQDSASSTLTRGKEISASAYKEWQNGYFEGTLNKSGYYYMVYYWRMNDGRYLSDTKLVQITQSSYTVSMISAILRDDVLVTEEPTDSSGHALIDVAVENEPTSSQHEHWIYSEETAEEHTASYDGDGIKFPSYVYGTYTTALENGYYNYTLTSADRDASTGDIPERYIAKGVSLTTSSSTVSVAWQRDTDYVLTNLKVQVWDDNRWNNMVTIVSDSDGSYSFEEASYSYMFESSEYQYNAENNTYSVVTTKTAMKSFNVKTIDYADNTRASQSMIVFDLRTSSDGVEAEDEVTNTVDLKNIRCIAYFRKVSASVTANKYVLIDDGNDEEVRQNYATQGVVVADSYREVNNSALDDSTLDFADQKAVLSGDTLIYRTQLRNDGYYNASTTNLYETLPSGVHLVDGSVKLYRQRYYIVGDSKYGAVESYADGETISQTKTVTNGNVNYTVETKYKVSEETLSDGTVQGTFSIDSITVTDDDGNTVYTKTASEIQAILNSTTSEEYTTFQSYNRNDSTGGKLYSYKVYDRDGQVRIDWSLETVSMEYFYYFEYKVVVDDIGVENTDGKTLESKTLYDNVFKNGSTLTGEYNGYLNSNYDSSSLMQLVESNDVEDALTAGERTYTVDFKMSEKYADYLSSNNGLIKDVCFENVLDTGFAFEEATIYKKGTSQDTQLCSITSSQTTSTNNSITMEFDKASRLLTISGIQLSTITDEYYVVISGNQTVPTARGGIVSRFNTTYTEYTFKQCTATDTLDTTTNTYYTKVGNTYTKVSSPTQNNIATYYTLNTPIPKENSLSKTEQCSNTTQSLVDWLYVNLEKVVPAEDVDQTFIFKVERYEDSNNTTTPTDTFYVDVRCNQLQTDEDGTTYYGVQPILLGKRGYYTFTEVTNWSATDYTTTPTKKYSVDLEYSNDYNVYTTAHIPSSDSISITLPSGLYTSTAIALPSLYTENGTPNYPTVTFTNRRNSKVWKTAQSYAQNSLSPAN